MRTNKNRLHFLENFHYVQISLLAKSNQKKNPVLFCKLLSKTNFILGTIKLDLTTTAQSFIEDFHQFKLFWFTHLKGCLQIMTDFLIDIFFLAIRNIKFRIVLVEKFKANCHYQYHTHHGKSLKNQTESPGFIVHQSSWADYHKLWIRFNMQVAVVLVTFFTWITMNEKIHS